MSRSSAQFSSVLLSLAKIRCCLKDKEVSSTTYIYIYMSGSLPPQHNIPSPSFTSSVFVVRGGARRLFAKISHSETSLLSFLASAAILLHHHIIWRKQLLHIVLLYHIETESFHEIAFIFSPNHFAKLYSITFIYELFQKIKRPYWLIVTASSAEGRA